MSIRASVFYLHGRVIVDLVPSGTLDKRVFGSHLTKRHKSPGLNILLLVICYRLFFMCRSNHVRLTANSCRSYESVFISTLDY